ncbi:MAG: 4-phosphopantetheinyl transferase [Myxococcales bacterium]|nr:4-phosphopantetheinyl transferase [Myxococcales bacterium]
MTRTELETPHGRCLIIDLGDPQIASLPAAEQVLAKALGEIRQRELVAGRTALRELLGTREAILADDRGAPVLPAGFVGSISHKGSRAAAIVAPAGLGHIGIDLELAVAPRQPIGRRILTADEQRTIGDDGRAVTLHFAIKEAIYKAVDPIVRRYVGFTEVSLVVGPPGECSVTVVDRSALPVTIEAWWTELEGHWVATARARRR